jgi:hypothetical protein
MCDAVLQTYCMNSCQDIGGRELGIMRYVCGDDVSTRGHTPDVEIVYVSYDIFTVSVFNVQELVLDVINVDVIGYT